MKVILIGVVEDWSMYKITLVHGSGEGKIMWSGSEIIVMFALMRKKTM